MAASKTSTSSTKRYPETKVLSKNFDLDNSWTLDVVRETGAYTSLEKGAQDDGARRGHRRSQDQPPSRSWWRGLPTGVKWGFVPKDSDKPKYICLNADESEPGTFKDRWLMELDPHLVIEGCLITAYAVGAEAVWIYVRGEYPLSIQRLNDAIDEARKAGFVGDKICGTSFACEVYVHAGAGAYICGEETALLESLEGKRGHPAHQAALPCRRGCVRLSDRHQQRPRPLAHVPWIIEHGGKAFAKLGIAPDPDNPRSVGSAGTKLMGVSGDVQNPGCWEFEFGITLRELLYDYAGGPLEGREFKAVIPGGLSMPVLTGDELDVKMGL